jgi:hypothetical protein
MNIANRHKTSLPFHFIPFGMAMVVILLNDYLHDFHFPVDFIYVTLR